MWRNCMKLWNLHLKLLKMRVKSKNSRNYMKVSKILTLELRQQTKYWCKNKARWNIVCKRSSQERAKWNQESKCAGAVVKNTMKKRITTGVAEPIQVLIQVKCTSVAVKWTKMLLVVDPRCMLRRKMSLTKKSRRTKWCIYPTQDAFAAKKWATASMTAHVIQT